MKTRRHHFARGPKVPLDGIQPSGNKTPLVQCTFSGAFTCRILYVNLFSFRNPSKGSSFAPLWLISTRSGTSVNFNQQSPAVCTCASGSKQMSLAMSHQTNALHGRSLNGPPPLPGTCSRHFCAHCSAVAGSTIETLVREINNVAPNTQVSVVTLAIA